MDKRKLASKALRNTMNITYKLTLNEYQEAVNFHYKTGKQPIFVAIFLGMATFMMLIGTNFANTQEVISNIFMTFFSLSFYILFTRIIRAYQAKKVYLKSPILSHEVTLHISGKGIRQDQTTSKTSQPNTSLPWKIFSKWKHNDKYHILYTSSYQFNVIPKRAMEQKEQEEIAEYFKKYILH
jgi:histone deacetylase complex regulatory component SIN3